MEGDKLFFGVTDSFLHYVDFFFWLSCGFHAAFQSTASKGTFF